MCAQCRLIVLDTANSYTGKFDNLYNKMSPQKNAYYSIFLLDNYYQPLVLGKNRKMKFYNCKNLLWPIHANKQWQTIQSAIQYNKIQLMKRPIQ